MGPELVLHSSQGERRSKIGSYKKALPRERWVAYQNTRPQKTDSSNQDRTTREKAQGRLASNQPRPAVNTHPTPKWHHVSNHKPRLLKATHPKARQPIRARNAPTSKATKRAATLRGESRLANRTKQNQTLTLERASTQEAPREQPQQGREPSMSRASLTKERLQEPLHPPTWGV